MNSPAPTPPACTLIAASPGDDTFLDALYADVHACEFAPLGLPPAGLAQILALQVRSQRAGYAQQFPRAVDRIVMVDGTRAGRILTDAGVEAVQLVDFALLTPWRGCGLGTLLLRRLFDEAGRRIVRLHVREGNPALRLYLRLGFVITGGDGMNLTLEGAGARRIWPRRIDR